MEEFLGQLTALAFGLLLVVRISDDWTKNAEREAREKANYTLLKYRLANHSIRKRICGLNGEQSELQDLTTALLAMVERGTELFEAGQHQALEELFSAQATVIVGGCPNVFDNADQLIVAVEQKLSEVSPSCVSFRRSIQAPPKPAPQTKPRQKPVTHPRPRNGDAADSGQIDTDELTYEQFGEIYSGISGLNPSFQLKSIGVTDHDHRHTDYHHDYDGGNGGDDDSSSGGDD